MEVPACPLAAVDGPVVGNGETIAGAAAEVMQAPSAAAEVGANENVRASPVSHASL